MPGTFPCLLSHLRPACSLPHPPSFMLYMILSASAKSDIWLAHHLFLFLWVSLDDSLRGREVRRSCVVDRLLWLRGGLFVLKLLLLLALSVYLNKNIVKNKQFFPVKRKKADLRSHLRAEMDLQPKIPGKCKKVEIERVRAKIGTSTQARGFV